MRRPACDSEDDVEAEDLPVRVGALHFDSTCDREPVSTEEMG